MDLRRLRYFVTILETGSLSQAAEKLFVVQSALSAQVRKLEEEVGAQLFVRDPRGVRPTEMGQRLLVHARSILEQVLEAERDMKAVLGNPKSTVRIGIPSSISRVLTLPLLQSVEQALPGVSLHIAEALTGDLQDWLADGRLDIGILYRYPQEPTQERAEVLRTEPLYLVSPASDDNRDVSGTIGVSQLADFDLILPTKRHRIRRQADYEAHQNGCSLRIRHELDSLPQTLQLVLEGRGHSAMIVSSFLTEWKMGRVLARRITGLTEEAKLTMVLSAAAAGPTIEKIRQLVIQTTKALAKNGAWPLAI